MQENQYHDCECEQAHVRVECADDYHLCIASSYELPESPCLNDGQRRKAK